MQKCAHVGLFDPYAIWGIFCSSRRSAFPGDVQRGPVCGECTHSGMFSGDYPAEDVVIQVVGRLLRMTSGRA